MTEKFTTDDLMLLTTDKFYEQASTETQTLINNAITFKDTAGLRQIPTDDLKYFDKNSRKIIRYFQEQEN